MNVTGSQKFSAYFQPYTAEPDAQALETIHAASSFAKAHPLQPVVVDGFSAPPDPKLDVDGLSARRAEMVKQVLLRGGVPEDRITTSANGVIDPKNLPSVAVRRVDISVGK
jgi:outer membrane protein OmpA-like peptidoglycan-associated protein